MSEVALYRKYRPDTFKDVLGQDHIVSVLEGSLAQGKVAHAYLFSGTRGTGKTSVARILAREAGCSDKDLYEIDAASNRGIDDIRELREAVHTLPFESPYKVYIIDEVHMLTKEAFNALLKTLEEPPSHVIFILATTEAEKLPETIISRCQSFVFKKPTRVILKDLVISIAKKEGFTLEQSAADLIALLGDNSFRDTQGILQKIIFSSKDKKISIKEAEAVTGAPKAELVNNFVLSLDESNLEKGLQAIDAAVKENIDMSVFTKLLLHKVRTILLVHHAPDLKSSLEEEFSKEDFELITKVSSKSTITAETLYELLDAYEKIARAYISQLPLELALIKLTKNNA